MHAEYFVIDDGGECEVVENVGAVAPDVDGAELPEALVIKAVDLSDLSAFVVAPDEGDTLGVPHFEGDEEQEGLDRVGSSVNEVAHEQVICVWTLATHLEQLLEVVELAVDVSANL